MVRAKRDLYQFCPFDHKKKVKLRENFFDTTIFVHLKLVVDKNKIVNS